MVKKRVIPKDIELLKVQIHADRCHSFLTISCSLAFVILGLVAIFYTLLLDGLIESNITSALVGDIGFYVILITSLAVVIVSVKWYLNSLKQISDMIESINQGDKLPPLNELGKWKQDYQTKTEEGSQH